jgi:hypothetical protein
MSGTTGMSGIKCVECRCRMVEFKILKDGTRSKTCTGCEGQRKNKQSNAYETSQKEKQKQHDRDFCEHNKKRDKCHVCIEEYKSLGLK